MTVPRPIRLSPGQAAERVLMLTRHGAVSWDHRPVAAGELPVPICTEELLESEAAWWVDYNSAEVVDPRDSDSRILVRRGPEVAVFDRWALSILNARRAWLATKAGLPALCLARREKVPIVIGDPDRFAHTVWMNSRRFRRADPFAGKVLRLSGRVGELHV